MLHQTDYVASLCSCQRRLLSPACRCMISLVESQSPHACPSLAQKAVPFQCRETLSQTRLNLKSTRAPVVVALWMNDGGFASCCRASRPEGRFGSAATFRFRSSSAPETSRKEDSEITDASK